MLGPWAQTTSVDIDKADNCGTSTAYGDYAYVLGGESGGNYTDEVVYATLAADGTVGTWKHTTPLPGGGRADGFAAVVERRGHASPAHGERSPALGECSPEVGGRSPGVANRSPHVNDGSSAAGERSLSSGERSPAQGEDFVSLPDGLAMVPERLPGPHDRKSTSDGRFLRQRADLARFTDRGSMPAHFRGGGRSRSRVRKGRIT
jgi:hypothetical protein